MTHLEYRDQVIRDFTDRHFAKHRAQLVQEGGPDRPWVIRWAVPGTYIFSVTYLLYQNALFVSGDIGCATFVWSQVISPAWVAGCDFSYTLSKCEASESGRKFETWVAVVAKTGWLNLKEDLDEDSQIRKLLLEHESESLDKEHFAHIAREVYDASGDAELASMISDIGMAPHANAIGMWLGLRLAWKQLQEASTTKPSSADSLPGPTA